MITTYYHKFITSIKWNSYEQLTYQTVFILHELLLLKAVGLSTYGTIGTVFALTYLIGALLNFGFDTSISPFFTIAIQTKAWFNKLFTSQLLIQIIILAAAPPLLYVTLGHLSFVRPLEALLTTKILFVCWSLIITEGIKKSVRLFLQCAFRTKYTALVEAVTIISFAILVWGYYLIMGTVSLFSILGSLALCSGVSTILLMVNLYIFYRQLPEHGQAPVNNLTYRVMLSRFFGYGYQLSHQLFSSNVVVPSFAFFLGTAEAGTLVLLNAMMHFFKTIIQKTLGPSQEATLSQTRTLAWDKKRAVFNKTAETTFYALNLIALALLIICPSCLYILNVPLPSDRMALVYLFLIFKFSENFFSIYEKFYITEEKTHIYLAFTVLSLVPIMVSLNYIMPLSPALGIIAMIVSRLASLYMLTYFTFYRWGIKPLASTSPINFFYPAITSLSFLYALF